MLRLHKPQQRHIVCLALLVAAGSFLMTACASEEAPTLTQASDEQPAAAASPASETSEQQIKEAPILRPDRTYTIDDVAAAGFKKSKQYPTDTLPGVQDVWYGFFDQKDIEVRLYASHAAALENGVGPAEDATGRSWRKGGGEKGAGTKAMFTYGAYMVVGNMVLLCELDVANCEGLIENMP